MGAARPLPALGPAVMVPQRGPLLLLALSLGLACAQQTLEEVPVQPGFNAQKVEGRWLTIQLASSRAHLVSPADPLRLGLRSIWTRDEDVTFVLFWTGEGVCQGVNVTVHPTGLQGQFQGSCEWPRPPARVPCWARGGQGTPDALHQGHGGSTVPEGDALPVPSAAPGMGLGAEERGLTCHRPGSPTGEGGNSMHVCFVGTDYSNLVLYVRLEDAGEVTSLWALLARTTPGDPTWLGKYLEYVRELRLHKAPVFNLDARCPPAEA
ncbi:beta-lactoglobulin isoform X2 [Acinonyx jubatus]|uniref:Beta-lactoglobulin isoform X2 n=1 Tax=Acinonyx jubatus TaxID=32536 RepID=A0ABM3NLP0_ACIJB|nr:beta-lactoglobulin isoform X2 [Acinonyx jubatus]